MNRKIKIHIIVKAPRWKILFRPYTKNVRAACEAAILYFSPINGGGRNGVRKNSSEQDFPPPNRLLNRRVDVTVVLADDDFVKELNHTYRGKKNPTNVLSFPYTSTKSRNLKPEAYLGDIVLALETIKSEAKTQNKTFKNHAIHLIVHGVLHLLGHDHEKEKDAIEMETKEIKILKTLGVKNPYL